MDVGVDTAGGDDVPRKGGPGVATADLLVINKVDLAPHVGADVDLMLSDARVRRGDAPVMPTSLVTPAGAEPVATWIRSTLAGWQRSGGPVGLAM